MAIARALCCLASPIGGKPSDVVDARRRSTAACICCIGPHHTPSGAPSNADLSVRLPLISCCGSGGGGGDIRGRSSARTPTARRLFGVRSRTPRRGQVSCFPAPPTAAAAGGGAAVTRTPRTPTTTPPGRPQRACCVRVPAQGPGSAKLGRRRRWFRSARQTVAQTTPRFRGTTTITRRDINAHVGNDNNTTTDAVVKVYDARHPGAQTAAAAVEEETCSNDEYALLCREGFSREDVAAVTIQAYFRGHLARRAFKALKSLVRLQAVARGAYVRRQAEAAIHCMQAMVRLQMRVLARQEGSLLQS
ncbi:hypothetical protein BS78_01G491000 [Paspalum vaginatum]|nr:hypothetical protein BS78_01G491000 [Paspalum vaginatum]